MNDSRFLTQIPYQTQVSQNSEGGIPFQTQYDHAVSQDNAVDSMPPSAQNARPTFLTSQRIGANEASDEAPEEPPDSSGDLIECQPFILPAATPNIEATQAASGTASEHQANLQPFPLVDWIQRIRADTPKRWPTFALRWARTVSKEQQAILDQDDAWSPPLPGRPLRSGTVPIRLLNILTEKADRAAILTKAQGAFSSHQNPSVSEIGNIRAKSSPPPTAQAEASQRGEESSDEELEVGTQYASQWSVSPPRRPRRLAPPDTSPIGESMSRPLTDLHTGPGRRLTYDGVSYDPARLEEHCSPESCEDQLIDSADRHYGSSPPEERTQADSVTRNIHEAAIPASKQPIDRGSARLEQSEAIEDRTQFPPDKTTPKVQVKDTPYPKPVPKIRQPQNLDQGPPQSSFVGATYPVASSMPDQPHYDGNKDIPPGTADYPETGQTANSRALSQPGEHEMRDTAGCAVPHRRPSQATVRTAVGHDQSEDEVERELHPRKRVRLSPKKHKRKDPAYEAIDQRRREERRTFRQSISNGVRPRLVEQNSSVRNANPQRSLSRTSSPQHMDRRSHGLMSESGRTTATTLSFYGLPTHVTTPYKRANVVHTLSSEVLTSTLRQYRTAYPNYQGDQKAFTSAIRLIIRLRSQPREPHPSLWDDFVYRMSDDYKAHLQYCIEEGENALPYQEFYHIHVKRSERLQEVISDDVLHALQTDCQAANSDRARSLPRQHPSPKVVVPTAEKKRPLEATDKVSGDSNQPTRNETHVEVQSRQSASSPTNDVPIEIVRPTERKTPRRSLPWAVGESTQSPVASPKKAITEVVAAAPGSSASEKVAEWLNSSQSVAEVSRKLPDESLMREVLDTAQQSRRESERRSSASDSAVSAVDVVDEAPLKTSLKPHKKKNVIPESEMARFARLFASLQSEKTSSLIAGGQPINVYTW